MKLANVPGVMLRGSTMSDSSSWNPEGVNHTTRAFIYNQGHIRPVQLDRLSIASTEVMVQAG
jgi:hypothetical protein